jgi:hypothetical protein
MAHHIIANDRKYEGGYVAMASFDDETIVAFGRRPKEVMEKAIKAGAKEPVIVYVPRRDRAAIY